MSEKSSEKSPEKSSEKLPLKHAMDFAYGVPRELAPGVVRLVANNPGPFTFKGTNTYLIGAEELAVIDPGPADDAHIAAILAAANGRPITHILITHTHRDHTDGLPGLLDALGDRYATKVCGYGRTNSTQDETKGNAADTTTPASPRLSPSGGEFVEQNFSPDIQLSHGDKITGGGADSGAGWTLSAIHTPGHAPDHLCFALEGTGVLFSGDHVMSWNTTVIAPPEGSMTAYMASLDVLLKRDQDRIFLPGHGGTLENPARMLRGYIVHRQWREKAIHNAIRDGKSTIKDVVAVVYRGLNERLVPAAALSVLAHIEHLQTRGLVSYSDGGGGVFDVTVTLNAD